MFLYCLSSDRRQRFCFQQLIEVETKFPSQIQYRAFSRNQDPCADIDD